jgi:methylaspartate mutase epsilon subunit
VEEGTPLNGYPIVAHDQATTQSVLDGVLGRRFPVQVRHGSPQPQAIFAALTRAGLDAAEGGPVSYCLPYGRTSLRESVKNWQECSSLLLTVRERGTEPHLETFGGCMLGQLCPPGLLVAISILEGLFFRQCGLRSISLSYAQQTSAEQDEQAVLALRTLAQEMLTNVDWHIVIYAYMGVFPRTRFGALLLLEDAARLAVRTGAARIIVKTVAEAFRLPTVEENVEAIEIAALAAQAAGPGLLPDPAGDEVLAEARPLVEQVRDLSDDVGEALVEAFARGLLDVPYCLHPDNRHRSRSYIDSDGRLRWSDAGAMPITPSSMTGKRNEMTADGLLASLRYMERKFDDVANRA